MQDTKLQALIDSNDERLTQAILSLTKNPVNHGGGHDGGGTQ
jgi:hypothetical protein